MTFQSYITQNGPTSSDASPNLQNGPCPMQLVVVMAVRKAVSAATTTFTATSINRFFIR